MMHHLCTGIRVVALHVLYVVGLRLVRSLFACMGQARGTTAHPQIIESPDEELPFLLCSATHAGDGLEISISPLLSRFA
jgi:hypothetical protein